jgi:hypothetical protein
MDSLNLLVGFKGSAWTYLVIAVVFTITTLILVGSLSYFLKKKVTKGQRQLKKLKAQVDELGQRLQSRDTLTAAVAIELSGTGPFRLPLLTQFRSLITEMEDRVVTEFESQDGKQIYASIPYLAAAQLVNDDVSLPLQKVTLHPSTSIDYAKLCDTFRLPFLSRFEGHFYADCNIRVLAFLTGDGRRVFFPVSLDTYEKLLAQLEAALASDQQANSSAAIGLESSLRNSLRYPVRMRF